MNQQLDIEGNRHDIAPEHETQKLFDSAPQIRGQIALDTDACLDHPLCSGVCGVDHIAGRNPCFTDARHPRWRTEQ